MVRRQFDFGHTCSTIFAVFGSGFATWFSVSIIFLIPVILLAYLIQKMGVPLEMATPMYDETKIEPSTLDDVLVLFSSLLIYSMLVQLHAFLTTAACVHGVFKSLRKEKPSVADCITNVLSRFHWIFILSFCQSFLVGLGCLLCCVPGCLMSTIWYVAVPCFLVEKVGITEAFQRSSFLTLGNRWAVFGILALLFIITFLVSLSVHLFAAFGTVTLGIAYTLIMIVTPILISVGPGVVYHDLRETKEGLDEQDLEKVFG